MSKDTKFKDYIIKQVILEARHSPIFNLSEVIPPKLNTIVNDFTQHRIGQDSKAGTTYRLTNANYFWDLIVQWNRVGMTIENPKNLADTLPIFKKYIITILNELEITLVKRLGLRIIFFIPFNGRFEDLVDFFKSYFYSKVDIYESIGNIRDVGIVLLTLEDDTYNVNLNLGPFNKDEVINKVSTFKNYDDKFEAALMVDIDMYNKDIENTKLSAHIENSFASASSKINDFHKILVQ